MLFPQNYRKIRTSSTYIAEYRYIVICTFFCNLLFKKIIIVWGAFILYFYGFFNTIIGSEQTFITFKVFSSLKTLAVRYYICIFKRRPEMALQISKYIFIFILFVIGMFLL